MKYLAPQRPNGGVFDVVAFGAKNDGSADATAAFQAAWDAANTYSSANVNAMLLIPPGEYLLQERITAKANVVVSAYGAYIYGGTNFTSGQGNIMVNVTSGSGYAGGTDNVTIMGGIWDAKGQTATTDQTRNIFTVSNCRNWRFLDCTFRNVPTWHAIDANAIDGMEVRGCRFEGFEDTTSGGTRFFSEAIQLDTGTDGTPCKNVRVSDCYMGPAVDGSGLGGFGKLVGSHNPTVANTDFHSAIRVVNNTIIDAQDSGIAFYDTTEAVVANNLIKDAAVYGILFYGNVSGVSNRISVTGNSIEGAGTRSIFFDGASGQEFRNCVVSSNTCEPSPTSTQATIDVDRWIG
ncbi:MAG TPA: right-handed parallel beta-helix repeat-containing protein, partial [Nocardioides sp.]|nr:right-handed parallel beta-helix repeat-containing protein [Nocardioides sp.]